MLQWFIGKAELLFVSLAGQLQVFMIVVGLLFVS